MGKDLFTKLVEAGKARDKYRMEMMDGREKITALEAEVAALKAVLGRVNARVYGHHAATVVVLAKEEE